MEEPSPPFSPYQQLRELFYPLFIFGRLWTDKKESSFKTLTKPRWITLKPQSLRTSTTKSNPSSSWQRDGKPGEEYQKTNGNSMQFLTSTFSRDLKSLNGQTPIFMFVGLCRSKGMKKLKT